MSKLDGLARVGRNTLDALGRAWALLWFQDVPTTPLEITRIGVAGAMLYNYGLMSSALFLFWGDSGWFSLELAYENAPNAWAQSVFFYLWEPWQWVAFHVLFLFCCAAMMLGWWTSWVKWVVMIGELSYVYRNPEISYGVDQILSCLLFVLCLAPIGKALSLDRVAAVRAAKLRNLEAKLPIYTSPWTGACIRMIQIQMAILFFHSAFAKVPGEDWWDGNAIWLVFTNYEYYNGPLLDLFASHYWLVNIATYATLLIEFAFPFLIWQRATRPYLLAAAMFLHLQFGVFMGLIFFSFIMAMGHMSFLRQEWLSGLGAWWKRRIGAMEMIYDGRCGFCVRSMAWLLAFDGLGQIGIRDFRSNPSPVVSDEKVEKAIYLVLPDGRALPGFEAYRYVVLRVPGLWWMVPFFYIPLLSRLFGHPIYNWVAANRTWLSSLTKAPAPG